MKKKFTITESRHLLEVVYYTVEAETEEDALEQVQNGEVEADDLERFCSDWDYEYEVKEHK